ncbi:hypothetical protein EJ05DRAFT_150563 [Pseudovirgaria hyperparasitica]|uniref:Uncharacterized protein n=1 Tax=Pseudovirgaria hyperparasitica TaxID=470096 RepID=A0A6A6VY00_9PEZI|nr:uncharacterized protein EJ05DRAFT_150563 [Pseudovirgaria hyperparasitica]KAF2754157.1 hypothetical protein EJ05DRAFT_150563 [Pseudovirgaria hyperparasitica]
MTRMTPRTRNDTRKRRIFHAHTHKVHNLHAYFGGVALWIYTGIMIPHGLLHNSVELHCFSLLSAFFLCGVEQAFVGLFWKGTNKTYILIPT